MSNCAQRPHKKSVNLIFAQLVCKCRIRFQCVVDQDSSNRRCDGKLEGDGREDEMMVRGLRECMIDEEFSIQGSLGNMLGLVRPRCG
jgi:hypothetical protein